MFKGITSGNEGGRLLSDTPSASPLPFHWTLTLTTPTAAAPIAMAANAPIAHNMHSATNPDLGILAGAPAATPDGEDGAAGCNPTANAPLSQA